jgi:hypothetical protein
VAFCPHCGTQVDGAAMFCAKCGKSLTTIVASPLPPASISKRPARGKTIGVALFAAFLLILLMMKSCGDTTTQTETSSTNDATSMIAKCGPADEDYSSENENPRPLLLVRTLEYKSQNIRFVFMPPGDTKVGATPPYRWTLSAVLDTVTNEPLDIQIALKRMPCFRTIRER